jgi:hypothetical protein
MVDLAKEYKKEQDGEDNSVLISDNIASDSRQLYSDIEMLNIAIEGSGFEVAKLINISNALRYRSISRAGDEANDLLVHEYQKRNLSYENDILNALNGIISHLEHSTGMSFATGLPRRGSC